MLTDDCNSRFPVKPNGFGIYLHTPFCVHKCSYCDFYSHAKYREEDFATLVEGLVAEMRVASETLEKEEGALPTVTSIFFGGGTPSLIPMPLLGRVFSELARYFPIAADAEITLEANPETVSDALCEGLRTATPVNRVSLGAQSFRPAFLKTLERLGSPQSIVHAAGRLRAHGFSNFNLDLIFGIPGQDLDAVREDLDAAMALGPQHLSFYSLTLKPGHALYDALPEDDFAADLFEMGIARLASRGYAQYEISNFCRDGAVSRHNLLYWNGGDYLGFGPSAASRLFRNGTFRHRKQIADVKRWLAGAPAVWEETTAAQTLLEASFLELRRNEGVHVADFAARYRYDLTTSPKFPLFVKEGLIERDDERLRLTARGRLLADSVTRDLVP